jgi:hypothetical protein
MNVNSVTKGIMALLVGIALDKGFIKNVDQKVIDFFPDYIVKRGEKTCNRQVLFPKFRHLIFPNPRHLRFLSQRHFIFHTCLYSWAAAQTAALIA